MVIEKIWFHRHPLSYLLWPLLWPFSVLFGVISRSRRKAYQTGDKPSYRAPLPVVVVGNITAGGNGKTLLWFGWWKRCKTLAIVRGSFHVVMALKRPAIRWW